MLEVSTKDIGIFIRDAIDVHDKDPVEKFDWSEDGEMEKVGEFYIDHVDASDANNLMVVTTEGHVFRVSVVRVG